MSDHLTDFDRLVEQQDQELVRDGVVSPFTRLQLQALAEGKPIPHVWNTPAIQQATARLLAGFKSRRTPSAFDEIADEMWFDDENEE